jgi:hypothetical protein
MVAGLRSYLFAIGINVTEEVSMCRLVLTSDQNQIKNGQFDVDEMIRQLEQAVCQALADGFKGLWATGDMTWELGRDRNPKKLVEYEWKLEALFQRYPSLSGLCQYHLGTLSNDLVCNALISHPSIFINQTLTHLNPHCKSSGAPVEPVAPSNALTQTVQNLCALQLESDGDIEEA